MGNGCRRAPGAVGRRGELGGAGDAGVCGGLRGVPRRRVLPRPPRAGARLVAGLTYLVLPADRLPQGRPGRRRGQEPVRVRQGRRRPHRHQGRHDQGAREGRRRGLDFAAMAVSPGRLSPFWAWTPKTEKDEPSGV
jgi:hypothetical protein